MIDLSFWYQKDAELYHTICRMKNPVATGQARAILSNLNVRYNKLSESAVEVNTGRKPVKWLAPEIERFVSDIKNFEQMLMMYFLGE